MIPQSQKKNTLIIRILGIVMVLVVIGFVIYLFSSTNKGNTVNNTVTETSVKPVISSESAVKFAREKVQNDGVMSLDGRTTVVKDEQANWHISFPSPSSKMFGGEPHVYVDKTSGAITKVYYTQ
jgi:hypothetical protein